LKPNLPSYVYSFVFFPPSLKYLAKLMPFPFVLFTYRAVGIVLVVTRSKLVLDFALSSHFIHLVVATFYTGGLPRYAMWWASMAGACALALSLGIWGCRYRELQPITFGGNSGGGAASSTPPAENSGALESAGGDEEEGFSRGRERGRGRDGAGDYEMVRINEDERTK
jgi:hypothetical protein